MQNTEMGMTEKSTRAARGTIICDNTTMALLKANDYVAEAIRREMDRRGVLLINLTSSPGSGKTTLLQEMGKRLKDVLRIKVLVGDLETERDAERLREAGVRAWQIVTGGICHLEGQMIMQALENISLDDTDVLFIENVGNLVCPASFDLGEDYRVTLLASTEGDDKPKKYPRMFFTSDLMLISKSDLLPYLPFSVDRAIQDARDINPEIECITVSALTGEGMDAWCQWLVNRFEQKRRSKKPEKSYDVE